MQHIDRLYRITAALILIGICGCVDKFESAEPDVDPTIQMLTANAWTCASTWTDSDGTEHENRQIWSFDDTGNGYFKLIVRDGDSDPQERQNIRFQWAFTNQSFKVLCINGDAFIDRRYWLIESLTDSGLSAYTSMKDPVIYPGYDRTLLILTATTR